MARLFADRGGKGKGINALPRTGVRSGSDKPGRTGSGSILPGRLLERGVYCDTLLHPGIRHPVNGTSS